jgi:hypothetical protein
LSTNFTPSYSERFFLQVVDGLVLDQAPVDRNPRGLVLVKKTDTGQQASVRESYLLLGKP